MAAVLALLASAGRGGGWRGTAGESADGGGNAWLGQWESICSPWRVQKPFILGATMWSIFVQKVARSRKHKKGGPSQNALNAHAKKHKT